MLTTGILLLWNLTKDSNKNISTITYNILNLPQQVTFSDGSTIIYSYAADGTKLRTVHVINGTTTQKDYCANVVYENGVQKMLLTEEGYVDLSNSTYHYYLKDHQGNNRVVIKDDGTVSETNHYYPFGSVFASTGNVQPYKYNGKELDTKKGLNWYDYGARHYDATLGRFMFQDRFAEKYFTLSPYQYGANNPVCNIDVNGDSIWFSKHYIDGKLNKLIMNVIGKVYNDTNKKIDMQSVSNYIKKGIERAFKGNFDDVVFETSVHLSVVNKMEDVLDDDHLFVLTDKIKNEKIAGASSSFGGKVAFIDLDLFTGLYDEALGSRNYGTFTATHEFGHLARLVHETHNPFNIMRSGGHFYFTSSNQLQQIYNNWMSGLLNLGSNYMMLFGKKRPNVGKVSMFVTPF